MKKVELVKGMLVTTKTGNTAKIFSVHDDGYVLLETYGVYRQEDVKPAKKKYRLAKGADGKERSWFPDELFGLYMRGWRDGAGIRDILTTYAVVPEYERGYKDGWNARRHAAQKASKRVGYKPNILRLAKGKKDGTRQRRG